MKNARKQRINLTIILDRWRCWCGKCLALSILVLQKWRWNVSYPLFLISHYVWYPFIRSGDNVGPVHVTWRNFCLESCSRVQRFVQNTDVISSSDSKIISGVGYCAFTILIWTNIYYVVILAWLGLKMNRCTIRPYDH